MKLFRYCCGCVGFESSDIRGAGNGRFVADAVVVKACDGDQPYGFRRRTVDFERAYTSEDRAGEVYHRTVQLNDNDTATVMAALENLIDDGYRMRAVMGLLRERE